MNRRRIGISNPIGAEIFDAELGSREFYEQYVEYYDRFYEQSRRSMDYAGYAGKRVLEVGWWFGRERDALRPGGCAGHGHRSFGYIRGMHPAAVLVPRIDGHD